MNVKSDTVPRSTEVLIGLPLSIQRLAGDTLVLHFGEIRPHHSGRGTVGDFALHISCPWRLDGPAGTITGSDDRWEYAGPGERPADWDYEAGPNVQQLQLDAVFGEGEQKVGRIIGTDQFIVALAHQGSRGDVRLEFSNGHSLSLFPASCEREAWRLFAPGADEHLVFPPES